MASMTARVATNEEVDRLNRMLSDVFWLRWGREYDPGDFEDRERMEEISVWQLKCAPLPGESSAAERSRVALLRARRSWLP